MSQNQVFAPKTAVFLNMKSGPRACAEAASICWILRYNEIRNNFGPTWPEVALGSLTCDKASADH